jgi:hypothetical protein
MATAAKPSPGAIATCIALSACSFLLWTMVLPSLANLAASDAAGNAMGQAFTAIAIIVFWVLARNLLRRRVEPLVLKT